MPFDEIEHITIEYDTHFHNTFGVIPTATGARLETAPR